ncbi:hypothetical protein LTR02_014823 [Friedmanniomyces endolithicus]|nr:hypothetical protein LTR94_015761 [Friedmanniomyces endolithicus]KAK0771362.1 hypothetical protein LTR59_016137 [Friedmanniomyces endolithicus]KAK0777321.1 hypothetical protein LTR38_015199 [Friedmanniomyces endolithicus]KAK0781336.1 hypothetical protein LTR75_014738 [Friedmanniomyces endolithicus]KAK0836536.1 hypothetical protein LTR03_013592 [Friedmanniomyces endolithicus]
MVILYTVDAVAYRPSSEPTHRTTLIRLEKPGFTNASCSSPTVPVHAAARPSDPETEPAQYSLPHNYVGVSFILPYLETGPEHREDADQAEYKKLIGAKVLCRVALAAIREFVVEELSSELLEARVYWVYHYSRAGSV